MQSITLRKRDFPLLCVFVVFIWITLSPLLHPVGAVDYSDPLSPQTVFKKNSSTYFFPCIPSGVTKEEYANQFLTGDGSGEAYKTVCLDTSFPHDVGHVVKTSDGRNYGSLDPLEPEPLQTLRNFTDTVGTIVGEYTGVAGCVPGSAFKGAVNEGRCYVLSQVNGIAQSIKANYQNSDGTYHKSCLPSGTNTPATTSRCLSETDPDPTIIDGNEFEKNGTQLDPGGICKTSDLKCYKVAVVRTPTPTYVYVDKGPYAGQPYQPCRSIQGLNVQEIKDMIDNIPGEDDTTENWWEKFTKPFSLTNIGRNIIKAGLSVVDGVNANSGKAANMILEKTVGELIPPDSISHTAPPGEGKIFEYFLGCESDSICANSRDMTLITDMDIKGDDVCVPNDVYPKYIWNKMETYQAKRTPNQPGSGQARGIEPVPVAAGTTVPKALLDSGLADMCFKQIPYATAVEKAYVGGKIASYYQRNIEQRLPRTLAGLYPFPALSEFRQLGGLYGWFGKLMEPKDVNDPTGLHFSRFIGLQGSTPTYYGLVREHFIQNISSPWMQNQCDVSAVPGHCTIAAQWTAVPPTATASDVINAIPYKSFEEYAGVPPNSQAKIAEMQHQLGRCLDCARNSEISTALGCVPVDNIGRFITEVFFGILLGIAGSYCVLCVAIGAIRLQTSQGNSTEIEKVRKQTMQCLLGLLLIIFAVFLFKLIGLSLRIPGIN